MSIDTKSMFFDGITVKLRSEDGIMPFFYSQLKWYSFEGLLTITIDKVAMFSASVATLNHTCGMKGLIEPRVSSIDSQTKIWGIAEQVLYQIMNVNTVIFSDRWDGPTANFARALNARCVSTNINLNYPDKHKTKIWIKSIENRYWPQDLWRVFCEQCNPDR